MLQLALCRARLCTQSAELLLLLLLAIWKQQQMQIWAALHLQMQELAWLMMAYQGWMWGWT